MEHYLLKYYPLYEATKILATEDSTSNKYGYECKNIQTVLEDVNSPVTRKYQEKLFKSVINKGYIDFGSIPKSAGNIRNYDGYYTLMETLNVIEKVANEYKSKDVLKIVNIIKTSIQYIESLASAYQKGFATKCDYVMIEYNTYVYTIVEATTSILYEFIDYVKRPDKQTLVIALKNTKMRANLFFIEQLEKFNNMNKNMGIEYRKMLETMAMKGKENFTGATMLGVAAVSLVALAVVPITRELIYRFYHFRGNVAKSLEMQASFLEMNKACVESNELLTSEKKEKVLAKQLMLRNKLLKMADIFRVKSIKAKNSSKQDIENDNKLLTLDNLRDDISNSPMELI